MLFAALGEKIEKLPAGIRVSCETSYEHVAVGGVRKVTPSVILFVSPAVGSIPVLLLNFYFDESLAAN